jgi:hypothetical protein
MSFDIEFGVMVKGADKIIPFTTPECDHPTYNISIMLRKAMGWEFEQHKWYKVSEVEQYIYGGYCELIAKEYKYKQYNDPNGWGTTHTAIETLKSILDKINEIYESYDLSDEYIYIRW